jgi:cyclic-di-GMP phosphodiesterase TipF (flagellum assembly factor)
MTSKSNGSGRLAVLDVIVLIAMAVTATAFAAGLVINSGIDMVAGAIAGIALFMVMASSHYVITRSARSATVAGRIDELEEALIVLDGDLQRIDQVEDDVARLDLLNDRVERLDQVVSEYGGGDAAPKMAEIERFTQDLEQLRDRFESLRSDVRTETRAQREEIGTELKSLEALIKNLSRDLTTATTAAVPAAPKVGEIGETSEVPWRLKMSEENLLGAVPTVAADETETADASLDDDSDDDDSGDDREEAVPIALRVAEAVSIVEVDVDDGTTREEDVVVLLAEEAAPPRDISEDLRQAIEANRVDLYVQPVVTVPERQVRYFDAVPRIRTGDDTVITTGYEDVAERDGLLPRIDNMMLVKSVQLLRRLGAEPKLRGVFCNLSLQSLRDPDFFPELVEFLEENSALGDSLTFRLSQPSIQDLGAIELASLRTLGKIGFGFALEQVSNLDLDFAGLRDHFFRFIKVGADTFLEGLEAAKAPVSAADLTRHLDRFDLKLIVESVGDEQSFERLMQAGVELAEGDLFAEPAPVTAEALKELGGPDVA